MIKNINLPKQINQSNIFKNLISFKNYSYILNNKKTLFPNILSRNSIFISNDSLKNFFVIHKKHFSKNINNNETNESQEEINNDDKSHLLNNLDLEFEKLLEKSDNTVLEKRIKMLSIKLLQANSSKEIMNLYDEKYLKNLVEISADEIILILYFYTCLLDKEISYTFTNNPIKSILNIINSKKPIR